MAGRRLFSLVLLTGGIIAATVSGAQPAVAHPLGNFTVNQYSGLQVQEQKLAITYVVDMAEIPTFQIRPKIDTNADGKIDSAEASGYGLRECGTIASLLDVRNEGSRSPATVERAALRLPRGAAGLETLRLECILSASTKSASGERSLSYSDGNFAGRVGWREITAVGDGTTLVASTVPARSISNELTTYPADLLSSPPDVRTASLRVRPGGPTIVSSGSQTQHSSIFPRGVDQATTAFTALVARRHLTIAFGLFALLLAVALGAIHALAPGHGKTVMAAYLVGQRGSLRQSGIIALTVTATHTAGVLVLGVLLSVSSAIAPEKLYPLLGLASGVMLLAIGVGLLRRNLRSRNAWGHATNHDHGDAHTHSNAHPPLRARSLAAMGLAGGLVPSPSALVVLLGAIALHRAWFGVVLVVGYGMGMAATLTGAGLLLVRARGMFDRRASAGTSSRRLAALARAVPLATAGVISLVGLGLAARGAMQI